MFRLTFTNCPDAGAREFDVARDAVEFGQRAGFEFALWLDRELLASWSPMFGGLHVHTDSEDLVLAILQR